MNLESQLIESIRIDYLRQRVTESGSYTDQTRKTVEYLLPMVNDLITNQNDTVLLQSAVETIISLSTVQRKLTQEEIKEKCNEISTSLYQDEKLIPKKPNGSLRGIIRVTGTIPGGESLIRTHASLVDLKIAMHHLSIEQNFHGVNVNLGVCPRCDKSIAVSKTDVKLGWYKHPDETSSDFDWCQNCMNQLHSDRDAKKPIDYQAYGSAYLKRSVWTEPRIDLESGKIYHSRLGNWADKELGAFKLIAQFERS